MATRRRRVVKLKAVEAEHGESVSDGAEAREKNGTKEMNERQRDLAAQTMEAWRWGTRCCDE